jgi:hypothetical protein
MNDFQNLPPTGVARGPSTATDLTSDDLKRASQVNEELPATLRQGLGTGPAQLPPIKTGQGGL